MTLASCAVASDASVFVVEDAAVAWTGCSADSSPLVDFGNGIFVSSLVLTFAHFPHTEASPDPDSISACM